jgi:hypothetical protein
MVSAAVMRQRFALLERFRLDISLWESERDQRR